jgi:hypothetical protein
MELPTRFPRNRNRLLFGLVLAALLPGPPARAWSSKSLPMFEQVHQKAIDRVLRNQIDAQALGWLDDMQKTVDKEQRTAFSYEHAMTGVESGQTPEGERAVFIQEAEAFVRSSLVKARQQFAAGARQDAFTQLGQALHALEDATSPSHEGFQGWNQHESVFAIMKHCLAERLYPDGKAQEAYRVRLEGSVQWGYDIFTGKAPMPAAFFAAGSGALLLPPSYLKP